MHLDNLAASPSTWRSLRGQAAADGSLHPTGGGRRTEPKSLGLAAPSPVQAAAFSSLVRGERAGGQRLKERRKRSSAGGEAEEGGEEEEETFFNTLGLLLLLV